MKKSVLVLAILILLFFVAHFVVGEEKDNNEITKKITSQVESEPVKTSQKEESFIFVPYWTLEENDDVLYDEVFYFGITVDKEGIDRKELGFKNIDKFNESFSGKKFLTLRMVNSDINSKILRDKKVKDKIVNETIEIAKKKGFKGIVFDFEINALPFDSLIQEINVFSQSFYKRSKSNNLSFYIALYGDTFYRVRPYDVKFLSENSDKILIMAYDFHKSKGNPGPNFPLSGKEKYGYDLNSMVEDFSKQVSKDKISVVFGMFGYDWIINSNKKAEGEGSAMSLSEVLKMLEKCQADCKVIVDNDSKESNIVYKDENLKNHEIWFETVESVGKKKMLLKEKGINQIGFWAHSYF